MRGYPEKIPDAAAHLPRLPDTILVAPDAFKGTLSAWEVADAVAGGLEQEEWQVERCPLADGGEGTLPVLLEALGGVQRKVKASDPLGRTITATYGLGENKAGRPIAIVETASASGLRLIAPSERDPIAASTYGTGELLVSAVRAGAEEIYLGAGGSATTDGGAGAIKAIRDAGGLGGARLIVLCDVRTPFEQAARTFAPQKGADDEAVAVLSRRLSARARHLERDPRGIPMTGAAGGLSGGLWSAFGAQLVAGAQFVLEAVEFDRRCRESRAVVTGEGRLDHQSLMGKVVSEVATRARGAGVPCHAIVGNRALDPFEMRILDLQAVLEAGSRRQLRSAGRRLAKLL